MRAELPLFTKAGGVVQSIFCHLLGFSRKHLTFFSTPILRGKPSDLQNYSDWQARAQQYEYLFRKVMVSVCSDSSEKPKADKDTCGDAFVSRVFDLQQVSSEDTAPRVSSEPEISLDRDHFHNRDVRFVSDDAEDNVPIGRMFKQKTKKSRVRHSEDGDGIGLGKFREGDMVWAKVKSHPWWPGQVYNPALASTMARRSKKPGHMLIAFFGDCSYGWFMEADLVPFEPYFSQKSKQSLSKSFLKAVEESTEEVGRRAFLGLTCACRNDGVFGEVNPKGYVSVTAEGYPMPGVYSEKQITAARKSFDHAKMFEFLQRLAISPLGGEDKSVPGIKAVAEARAYRSAVVSGFRDEGYLQFIDQAHRTLDSAVDIVGWFEVESQPEDNALEGPTEEGKRKETAQYQKKFEMTKPDHILPHHKSKSNVKYASAIDMKESPGHLQKNNLPQKPLSFAKSSLEKGKHPWRNKGAKESVNSSESLKSFLNKEIDLEIPKTSANTPMTESTLVSAKSISTKTDCPIQHLDKNTARTRKSTNQCIRDIPNSAIQGDKPECSDDENSSGSRSICKADVSSYALQALSGDMSRSCKAVSNETPDQKSIPSDKQDDAESFNGKFSKNLATNLEQPIAECVAGETCFKLDIYPRACDPIPYVKDLEDTNNSDHKPLFDAVESEGTKSTSSNAVDSVVNVSGVKVPKNEKVFLITETGIDYEKLHKADGPTLLHSVCDTSSAIPGVDSSRADNIDDCMGNRGFAELSTIPEAPGSVCNGSPDYLSTKTLHHEIKKTKIHKRPVSPANKGNKVFSLEESECLKEEHKQDIECLADLELSQKRSKRDSLEFSMVSQNNQCITSTLGNEGSVSYVASYLSDLRILALDPFHGISKKVPLKVSEFFLKFRSCVYAKSLNGGMSPEPLRNGFPLHSFHELQERDCKVDTREDISCSVVQQSGISGSPPPAEVNMQQSMLEESKSAIDKYLEAKEPRKRKLDDEYSIPTSVKRLRKQRDVDSKALEKSRSRSRLNKVSRTPKGNTKEKAQEPLKSKEKYQESLISQENTCEPVKSEKLLSQTSPVSSNKCENPVAIVLKFPQGFALPSEVQLRVKFARFKSFLVSGTRIYCSTNSAQVVFRQSSDAEAAYNYVKDGSLFGKTNVKVWFRQLSQQKRESLLLNKNEVPKSAREGVEDLAIPSTPQEDVASSGLSERQNITENEGHAHLKSILKKLDEPGASNVREISPHVTSRLNNEESIPPDQIVTDKQMQTRDVNISFSTSQTIGISPTFHVPDVSDQMLSLLHKCNDIVSNLHISIGHLPYYNL